MNGTVRCIGLGVSASITVFAIVVPVIHLAVTVVASLGLDFGRWDNPAEVFIFLMTSAMLGVFPWGLWLLLTDARRTHLFDEDREAAAYLLPAIVVYLGLTLLVCTRLQSFYEQYQWILTPALLLLGVLLMVWRWRTLWRFSTTDDASLLENALAIKHGS